MNKDWLIAHRGAQKNARENTIEAFKDATKLPVSYIELDIHTTKDRVVICNHDFKINGFCISDSKYKDLKKVQRDLCNFEEAVRCIGNKKPIIVELKQPETSKHILRYLYKFKDWKVTSFNDTVINELMESKIDKKRTILLQHGSKRGFIKRAKRLKVGAISVNQRRLTPRFYRRAIFKGFDIYCYSVNSPIQARIFRCLYPKLKIYSDRPDLMENIK